MMRICHAGRLSGPTAKCVVGGIVILVLLAAGLPASAATKQEIWDQMVSINQQIQAIKGQPGQEAQLVQLRSQLDALAAELGYLPSFPATGDPGAPRVGGGPSVPPNCVSATNSVPRTDTPLPINDLLTTTSTLAVAGLDTYIWDVNVETSITHTWNADINPMVLTSPSGTVVTLTSANGGSNDNVYDGTLWDDDGGDTNPPGPASDNI